MSSKKNFIPTSRTVIQKLSSSFNEFSQTGAFGGVLLLATAIVAMVWANSMWSSSYFDLWNAPFKISISDFHLDKPLLIWVNDGLMAIFFFYVGLEIKREVKVGELSQPGQAILPIVAAVGGIVLPACLFLLMSRGEPGSEGWGVPMATDIAFSLGLLMLLGNRVPSSLKIFLTAFAIVDDLVAVAIIAVFYSSSINLVNLGWAAGVYVLMWGLNISNIRNGLAYFALAAIMWYFFLKGGIHPTVAGILAALAIPANSNLRMKSFVEKSRSALDQFWDENSNKLQQFLTNEQLNAIDDIDDNIEKVQPPLQRLEHGLNAQVNYFIMPVFALANAGVTLQSSEGGAVIGNLTWYVMLSLVMGKVVGITLFSWLAVQLKWAELPAQTNWINMVGVGLLGGVGFTMALFIGGLAFTNLALLNQAKIGILLGSLIAGTMGVLVLRLSLPKN
jgi:NhaA family Na+:H+ antiporter